MSTTLRSLSETSYDTLRKSVVALIKQGWQPHGSLRVINHSLCDIKYLQAMTRVDKPADNPIVDYDIVCANHTICALDLDVNAFLAEGWDLYGSPATVHFVSYGYRYYQVVVLRADPANPRPEFDPNDVDPDNEDSGSKRH